MLPLDSSKNYGVEVPAQENPAILMEEGVVASSTLTACVNENASSISGEDVVIEEEQKVYDTEQNLDLKEASFADCVI